MTATTAETANPGMTLQEERYQRLWQPPVPSQVLQFIAASAAICYTADKALRHLEEGESGLEQAVKEQPAKQMALFFQQLVADTSRAQEFFGTKVEYNQQPYSIEVAVQTPPGQKHVFMAPGANIPPSNGSWPKRLANVTSLRYLLQAELDEALSSGQVALQHASDRLGAEPSQPLGRLINAYDHAIERFK